jgi:hypothetical protein
MIRLTRSVVLAAAVLSSSVSAQAVDPRLVSRLDVHTRAAVVAIIDSARMVRLPTEPLVDKALEGAAKKANGQQIISAVRTLRASLAKRELRWARIHSLPSCWAAPRRSVPAFRRSSSSVSAGCVRKFRSRPRSRSCRISSRAKCRSIPPLPS